MFKMSRENLESTIRMLDQAIYNHENWYKDLMRSLTCHLQHDHHDLAEDSFRQCRFGQWYYSVTTDVLCSHLTFIAIEAEHTKMHKLATKLLLASDNNEVISPNDYDNFAHVLDRLRLNINSLKHEIEETLYNRDPLTGVRNRVSMLSELRQAHEMVKRGAQNVAIAIMDLDHFKAVNDTHGHPAGDAVLMVLGEYINDHMRPYDKVYRYGGEEFLISMYDIDIETAELVIERIRKGVMQYVSGREETGNVSITASFGIAMFEAKGNVELAIQQADKALYCSKSSGRNCVTVWSDSL